MPISLDNIGPLFRWMPVSLNHIFFKFIGSSVEVKT